jgi:hypothetical protein
MRSVLTTACEVAGAACIGFAFGVMPGLLALGAALIGAGIIEGRRA